MIYQEFYIKDYDWTIYAYFAVDCYYTDDIMEHLFKLRCNGRNAKQAYQNLSACKLDTGLTYTCDEIRSTLLVVGLTSSEGEFMNSFSHELFHAVMHIARANKLDIFSESPAYLIGELTMQIYPTIKKLLKLKEVNMCKCKNKANLSRLEQLLEQLWYELPQFEIENLKTEILEEIEKIKECHN